MNIKEEKQQQDTLAIGIAASLLTVLILLGSDVTAFGQVTGFGKVKKNSIGMGLVEMPTGKSFMILTMSTVDNSSKLEMDFSG